MYSRSRQRKGPFRPLRLHGRRAPQSNALSSMTHWHSWSMLHASC